MKKTLIITAIAATLAAMTPAKAAIYNYNAWVSNGIGSAKVTVDTHAGTAKYSGRNINLTLTSNQLKNFNGLTRNRQTFLASNISGTFTRYGRTYNAYSSTRPKYTQVKLGKNYNFLWTYGRDRWGRTYDFDGKGGLKYTGSTGGTPVPAPGMLGLLALALAGLGFARRPKAVKATA